MNRLRTLLGRLRIVAGGRWTPLVLYIILFAVLMLRALQGVGQYWDWTFPYYTDQVSNFFSRGSESWTYEAGGSPLGYSSDYFVRFVVSLLRLINPEWLLYALIVCLFVAGGYGVYLISRHYCRGWMAFLLGLAAMINPAIFYKFTAGHIDYLVSYVLLIYMIHFLLHRFRPDYRSAVVLGLFVALIGAQIQFFAIAAVFVLLFFIFRHEQWRWRFLPVLIALPLLVNAVWLSNFIFGGADVSQVSGEATKAAFKGTTAADYLNIFSFSFSKATLISRFYGAVELLLYGLLFLLMTAGLLRSKKKQIDDVWLLGLLLIMLFLATGLFQLLNLGPINMLYPMFREVGHFAPLIVLLMVILLGRLVPRGIMNGLAAGWLVLVIGISFAKYQVYTESLNFGSVRKQFAEFKDFGDQHKSSDQRVLSYPFFDQYAFTGKPVNIQDNLPLSNSGHDSFAAYNNQQFIKNAVKPQDFKTSVQYRLLQTMNVDVLRPYNVRYIYDFSHIYESYYERYVPPSTYGYDISWIKNDPDFTERLLQFNPGKLKRVSDHILEVTDYNPRIAANDKLYSVANTEEGERSREFMGRVFPDQNYNYQARDLSQQWRGGALLSPLFATANGGLVDVANKSLSQTIYLGKDKTALYGSTRPSIVTYQASAGRVVFYAVSTGRLYAGDQLVQDDSARQPLKIGQMQMQNGQNYYIGLGGDMTALPRDGAGTIGHINGSDKLELYAVASHNLISNPSFEPGLWEQNVGDCNAYDNKPVIGMKRADTASDGKHSLELSATRHDACTSTKFDLKGNSLYMLSYDYQSSNADSASFYLRFNNTDQGAIKRYQAISDDRWHTMNQPFLTPDDARDGQLFLHALASNKQQPNINHYDKLQLVELLKVGETSINLPDTSYVAHQLSANGNTTFRYVDDSYDYKNAIKNGSFENGPWQDKVVDCNNYDASAKIAQSLSEKSAKDHGKTLQLEAARHTACTYTLANVRPDTDYLLSFDYQGDPAEQVGYYMEFVGDQTGMQERIDVSGKEWNNYSTRVHVPAGTTSVRLFLHVHESNGAANNIARFDNVRLIAMPDVDQLFYAVGSTEKELALPRSVSFVTDNVSRRTVKISGASGPFVLNMSESYHPGWRLEFKGSGSNSWWPDAVVSAVGQHFKINGYGNGWYIDPPKDCAGGCHRNPDGSFDMELVAEFVPQRWFNINRMLSVGALLLSGGYIAVTHRAYRRKYEQAGVYRHPLLSKNKR